MKVGLYTAKDGDNGIYAREKKIMPGGQQSFVPETVSRSARGKSFSRVEKFFSRGEMHSICRREWIYIWHLIIFYPGEKGVSIIGLANASVLAWD